MTPARSHRVAGHGRVWEQQRQEYISTDVNEEKEDECSKLPQKAVCQPATKQGSHVGNGGKNKQRTRGVHRCPVERVVVQEHHQVC